MEKAARRIGDRKDGKLLRDLDSMATDAVLGAAKLVKETGEHPIALCNQVCSPGGTTIEGVLTLKRLGFESAVQQATQTVIDKDRSLAK